VIYRRLSSSQSQVVLLFFVPLVNETRHFAAEFPEFVDVVNHFCSGEACNGIILSEVDRLLGADFLAEPAIDATDHVDIKTLGAFFYLAPAFIGGNFLGVDGNSAGRANEFAKLATHAFVTSKLIADERRRTTIPRRQLGVPLLLGILHGHFCLSGQKAEHVFERDQQPPHNRGQVDLFGQCEARTRYGVCHKIILSNNVRSAWQLWTQNFSQIASRVVAKEDKLVQKRLICGLNLGKAALEDGIWFCAEKLGFLIMLFGELK